MRMQYVFIDNDGGRHEFGTFKELTDYLNLPEKSSVDAFAERGYCAGWLHSENGSDLVIKTNPASCPIIPGLGVPVQGVSVVSTPEGGTFYGIDNTERFKAGEDIPYGDPRWKVAGLVTSEGKPAYPVQAERKAANEVIEILAENIGDEHKDKEKYAEQAEKVQKLADQTDLVILGKVAEELHTISKEEGTHAELQSVMLSQVGMDELRNEPPKCQITDALWEEGQLSSGEYVLAQLVNAGLIDRKAAQENLKKIDSILAIEDISCGGK